MDYSDEREYLSREGFERLKKDLEHLKTDKRRDIADRLEYAKGLGDLSENSEYHEAKEAQMENERRIAEIEDILARSVIMTKAEGASSVAMGSTVVVSREDSSETSRFVLVGSEEADPSQSKISYESPLGRSLLGKKKGEEVSITAPRGEIKYKIVDIM
ncbi:MAG: transcription elongation factor GreA [Candidatus Niyogibacteria bacterium]|nr:transcription elongation factor GreA [Candidatus Niyogibacteria bacterium]